MEKTAYKIKKQDNNTFTVINENGSIIAKGLLSKYDALKAIWVYNGSNKTEFYHLKSNNVFCEQL